MSTTVGPFIISLRKDGGEDFITVEATSAAFEKFLPIAERLVEELRQIGGQSSGAPARGELRIEWDKAKEGAMNAFIDAGLDADLAKQFIKSLAGGIRSLPRKGGKWKSAMRGLIKELRDRVNDQEKGKK